MHEHPLNELYSLYKKGKIKRREFEGLMYQYLLKNQPITSLGHWKFIDYEEFLSSFYQRLHKAIDSYKETGSTFEVFFMAILRRTAKEYKIKTITKSVIENYAWSIHIPEMYTHEEPPVYSCDDSENENLKLFLSDKRRKNPKQIIALILKCYHYISDDFLERIAEHTGIDETKLKEMMNKVREIRNKRDGELFLMKERIYGQYYRCIVYEKRLALLTKGTTGYLILKGRLEKARQRLKNMRRRFSKARTDASNREIAEVIGTTKGTVDSSLYSLKNRWEVLAKKAMLN